MSVVDQTPNFKLNLPTFDLRFWHTYMNSNMTVIDAVLGHYLGVNNLVGVWQNSTVYNPGQRAVDPAQGTIYECVLGNTSAPIPTTFMQERANNPHYWGGVTIQQTFRGTWANSTTYSINDFVVSGNIYAVCATSHTSNAYPGVFGDDAVYWIYLINLAGNVLPSITGHGSSYVRALPNESGTEYRTPTQMRADLGISNVVTSWNTRLGDVNLTLTDVTNAGGAPLASPGLTGVPTGPTAAPGTNTTQLATTAFVSAVTSAGGAAYAIVANTPPNPALPVVAPPMGLLFADTSVPDAAVNYLPLAGGTLTGALTVNPASGTTAATFKGTPGTVVNFDKTGSGNGINLQGMTAGVLRWAITPGTNTPETGSNVGSDFAISRASDAYGASDRPRRNTFNRSKCSGRPCCTNSLLNLSTTRSSTDKAQRRSKIRSGVSS